jgi:hypothetical protein
MVRLSAVETDRVMTNAGQAAARHPRAISPSFIVAVSRPAILHGIGTIPARAPAATISAAANEIRTASTVNILALKA